MKPAELDEAEALASKATPEVVEALRNAVRFYCFHWYIDEDGKPSAPKPDAPTMKALEALPLVPSLVSEVRTLLTHRDELLATIARLSNELPFPDEVRDWQSQRAALLAEIGTLKAEREEARRKLAAARWDQALERDVDIRHFVERAEADTAEAIAAWVARHENEGFPRVNAAILAADIRANRWKEQGK